MVSAVKFRIWHLTTFAGNYGVRTLCGRADQVPGDRLSAEIPRGEAACKRCLGIANQVTVK